MYSGNVYINMKAENNVYGIRLYHECVQNLQNQNNNLDVNVSFVLPFY